MLRIDALWLCAQPVDMRAGAERLLAAVVTTLGEARAHHGYLFANARATRVKLLVHDGFGIWCAARRVRIHPLPRTSRGKWSQRGRSRVRVNPREPLAEAAGWGEAPC
ncbi:IS66 family insertion sequence element accessory protein TnpB [Sphaerotilus microaerophilus]|uniref:Transposase n=1 Tax=Sphaerotilus microaerophilus TaxID=2914710 RepID=A0ABM7YJG1_9BURK|nr:IS66 family insertion sequence element accessory protein TnpB [Sphaerotilus sp. FB-5]BDI04473.1 hypothetical protein CATMQ487_14430 [Sphaerotilus sp. FB-5]